MVLRTSLTLAFFAIALPAGAFAGDACVLSSLSPDAGAFGTTISKEVQAGCGVLQIDELDYQEAVQKAKLKSLRKCCQNANKFIAENTLPCIDDAKTKYQIQLAFAICHRISYEPDHEQDQCLDGAADAIPDPRVSGEKGIGMQCLGSESDAFRNSRDLKEGLSRAFFGVALDTVGGGTDEDDADYDCEHKGLKGLVKKLDISLLNAPTDPEACSLSKVSDEKGAKPAAPATGTNAAVGAASGTSGAGLTQ